MKKLLVLLTLLVSFAAANAKCDWSKVYLSYGNSCNVYKFEVAGTVDTCYQVKTIVTNRKTLKKDTFYTRSFGIAFADTGKYNVFVKVHNKCLNCDTAFEKLIYVTCKPTTKPKCNWSKLGFGYGNSCNIYKFELGSIDTCLSYRTFIYSYRTARVTDTLYGRTFTKVFADTGKYKVYVMAYNKCGGCDTAFYKLLTVTCFPTKRCDWSKAGIFFSNKCDTVTFEMGSYIDTCIQYSSWAYQQKTKTWFILSDKRVFRRGLDTGSYIIKTKFYNKCLGCDTFIYREIYIKCDSNSTGVSTFSRNIIRISPNPADSRIMVCLATNTKQPRQMYTVYNGSGQIVADGNIVSCITLNTFTWREGIYIIKIGNSTQRFVIKH